MSLAALRALAVSKNIPGAAGMNNVSHLLQEIIVREGGFSADLEVALRDVGVGGGIPLQSANNPGDWLYVDIEDVDFGGSDAVFTGDWNSGTDGLGQYAWHLTNCPAIRFPQLTATGPAKDEGWIDIEDCPDVLLVTAPKLALGNVYIDSNDSLEAIDLSALVETGDIEIGWNGNA